jgi:hypothetical protein
VGSLYVQLGGRFIVCPIRRKVHCMLNKEVDSLYTQLYKFVKIVKKETKQNKKTHKNNP